MALRPDMRSDARLIDRFFDKVTFPPGGVGCWIWNGARVGFGYGNFNTAPGTERAHRMSYYLLVGDIPAEAIILHRCDNASCVNPEHLKPGTHAENTADMLAKGRNRNQASGPLHGRRNWRPIAN